MTREEVIANAKHWGLDMSKWEEKRIQQIVDICNEPITFSKEENHKYISSAFDVLYRRILFMNVNR